MAILTKETEIDGKTFAVFQFPARKGLELKARLLKLVGPVLAGLAGAAKGGKFSLDDSIDTASIIAGLAAVDPAAFVSLAVDLVAQTKMNGVFISAGTFDLEFAAEYGTLYKLLGFVVETNFGKLFGAGGIGGLVARLTQMVALNKLAPLTKQ